MDIVKGFNKDMTCRGFQFKEGETYVEELAILCRTGFHGVVRPIDVFAHYEPSSSVYHECNLEDVADERDSNDSKVCGKKITIGCEIGIPSIALRQIDYAEDLYGNPDVSDEHQLAVWDGQAALVGIYSCASAGYEGYARSGDEGASATRERGTSCSGIQGAAASGHRGASITQKYGASACGEKGLAFTGDYGAAAASYSGVAYAKDDGVSAAGNRGYAHAGREGVACSGNDGLSVTGRYGSSLSRGKSSAGVDGVAVARGNGVMVKGKSGALLVIIEENPENFDIKSMSVGVVDGKTLKPDIWYRTKNNRFVEVEKEVDLQND